MISACFDIIPSLHFSPIGDWIQYLNDHRRSKGALQSKQKSHAYLCFHGLEFVPIFQETLFFMFVECESFSDAKKIFNKFPPRSENSWTSLIQVYVENGALEHGFMAFYQMQEENLQPNKHIFSALLKACGKMKSIDQGREIYAQIVEQGLDGELFIGSGLVDMYVKCESLVEAQDVLYHMSKRNVVTWTSLMAGYAQNKLGEEALDCLDKMEREGISPNWVSFIYSLKACTNVESSIHKGMELHNRVLETGFEQDAAVCNSLMDMYLRHGLLCEAKAIFEKVKVRNVVLWTEFILGYIEHGLEKEALQCFEKMRLEGVQPDPVTYVCGLKACIGSGFIKEGREMHVEIVIDGLESDIRVGTALIDMYAKSGLINDAGEIFEELQVLNIFTPNFMRVGYEFNSNDREDSFNSLPGPERPGMPPDVACWTSLISGYAEQGENEVAVQFYCKMLEQGIFPNMISFMSMLKGCGDTTSLHRGKMIHAQICKMCKLEEQSEMILQTALIDMYSKCGSMVDARQIFNEMSVKDGVTWNTLIGGYAYQGEIEEVIDLVEKMNDDGIPPTETTLISVLIVCSHSGLVEESKRYLKRMENLYWNIFTVKKLNCIVDLLTRVGRLSEGLEMVGKVDVPADVVTWNTILSACQKMGDFDQGRQVFEHMVRLDYGHDGAYIMMSNLYADGQGTKIRDMS